MAIEAINWAMQQEAGGPGPKLLLILLADHVSLGRNSCYPSIRRISEVMECGRSTVFEHLARLEAQGLVERRKRDRRGGKGQTSNLYVLSFTPEREAEDDDGVIAL